MSSTGFIYHPAYARHLTGAGHPERPERVTAVLARLQESGLTRHLDLADPKPADPASIVAVHAPDHLERVRDAYASGVAHLDGDTVVSAQSYHAALLAAGGAVQAADRVLDGDWSNAFVACRPPGHHAEAATAMGFCLFNNVAVAAQHLRSTRGLERVSILDWDVHHGNGTQHIFERDASIQYVSLHQYPWYPGTGAASERGIGAGDGATLNCPMPAGAGDLDYLTTFEEEVLPGIEEFGPEFLLISAGFDAHARDPLSYTQVSTEGFRRMTELLLDVTSRVCKGRVVSLLEGGYDLEALADSVEAHVEELVRLAPAG